MGPNEVKAAVEGLLALAADQLKQNGSFKIGGVLNMRLKKRPATPARKGVNPFTKEPCVIKAKPASKAVRVLAMKKLKESILSIVQRQSASGAFLAHFLEF